VQPDICLYLKNDFRQQLKVFLVVVSYKDELRELQHLGIRAAKI
jgi:hypothetical protein